MASTFFVGDRTTDFFAPKGGDTGGGTAPGSHSSFIPDYQEEPFLNQLAQYSQDHADELYRQAQRVFNGTSAVSSQAVDNYLKMSQGALDQSNKMWSRYTGAFQPQEDALLRDANTYSSADRIRSEMGRAGSTAAQASKSNRDASLQRLKDYGVDVSSGRFAGLDRAEAAQAGAVEAGAQNQARLATEATGRGLRSEAIQVGERYPGQVMNALQAAQAGQAGAVNAALANANTGANLLKMPNDYLRTAMELKYPPLGQRGQQYAPSSGGGGGGSSGSSPSGGGSRGSGGGGSGGGAGSPSSPYGIGASSGMKAGPSTITNPFKGGEDWTMGGQNPSDLDWSYLNNDENGAGGWDEAGFSGGTYDGGSSYDGGSWDGGGSGWDQSGGEGYFAEGGSAIDLDGSPTTGGFVSQSLSPSGGQQTDDVNAKLNANEFVIPRDVALWKGQEFFQKLIETSRQNRSGAPAKPSYKQPVQAGAR